MQACLGVVAGEQLRLHLNRLGKLRREHLRNPLMVELPCALQQRLIGGFLDENMLKKIARLRGQAPLID